MIYAMIEGEAMLPEYNEFDLGAVSIDVVISAFYNVDSFIDKNL